MICIVHCRLPGIAELSRVAYFGAVVSNTADYIVDQISDDTSSPIPRGLMFYLYTRSTL